MSDSDDARIMRERHAELEAALREAWVPDSASCVLGQTYTLGTYPTAAQRFYACHPVDIAGTETEGATPTLSAQSGTFMAFNAGGSVPPSGTYVLCVQSRGYWVFRYG